ncbi:TAF9 [Ecytonucleospora hepatopenaei]|uniref:TAF9 n=1 Tax=Ecytonucleospora hepatopenaei TaxID=646526 RepID=A0A1W0E2E5_9MICR|nr:transcription init factor, TAF9 [Ecytonucleospora hepatopenaei]OQS54935.1 TAF9 [Ecytonucleospora hepatopenaei]
MNNHFNTYNNKSEENLLPRDAKVISAILRSLGIEECEPKVIIQLLEFAYKYSTSILVDAHKYATHCERDSITPSDIKLAIQTKSSHVFVPAPSKTLLQAHADAINKNPLTIPDSENLIRVPNVKSGVYGVEFEVESVKEKNDINEE